MKKLIIVGAIVVVIGGGAYWYYKQLQNLKNLTYKVTGFSVGSLGLTKSVINLNCRIFSNSTLSATVSNLDLNVFIDGNRIGNITNNSLIIIPAMGYSDLSLQLLFSPLEIGEDALNIISNYANNQDSKVLMTGFCTVRSSFIQTTVPFTYESTIKEMMAP